jgi:hypothetical protein
MASRSWTENDLNALINNAVEESLSLEYKAAKAVSRSDAAKREITKDVSAMANSAGGILIYGVKEYDDAQRHHLPEGIDPVDRLQYSREWLEQIINQIQPRIIGLVIHTVGIQEPSSQCVYVIDIPASDTAHQAANFRYYRRFNFEAVPMPDHEVRDVMGRRTHPTINLDFQIATTVDSKNTTARIRIIARNSGRLLAQYINAFVNLPETMLPPATLSSRVVVDGYCKFSFDNTVRDVVDVQMMTGGGSFPKYGPSRFDPLLPGVSRTLHTLPINPLYFRIQPDDTKLYWSVNADNAAPNSGHVRVLDIPRIENA